MRAKYVLSDDARGPESFTVSVSTDRNGPYTELWSGTGIVDFWSDIGIDLSAYAGQDVYVRIVYDFEEYAVIGGGIWIDYINVEEVTNPELEGQPEYYTVLTGLTAGSHTLAAVLTDESAEEHAVGPSFTLNIDNGIHILSFDAAGGSPVDPITNSVGNAVVLPADPERLGYVFSGWDPVVPATMPDESLTFTAQWTLGSYTITFNTAGGSPSIAPITQDYGTPVVEPSAPSRTGYTFSGWNPAFPTNMPGNDLTLTAQWIEKDPEDPGGDIPKPEISISGNFLFGDIKLCGARKKELTISNVGEADSVLSCL